MIAFVSISFFSCSTFDILDDDIVLHDFYGRYDNDYEEFVVQSSNIEGEYWYCSQNPYVFNFCPSDVELIIGYFNVCDSKKIYGFVINGFNNVGQTVEYKGKSGLDRRWYIEADSGYALVMRENETKLYYYDYSLADKDGITKPRNTYYIYKKGTWGK